MYLIHRSGKLFATVILFTGIYSGCIALDKEPNCTLDLRFGIKVTAVDSLSRESISDFSAIARDGMFVDSTSTPSRPELQETPSAVSLVSERVGNYSVSVSSSGYAPWQISDVEVKKDALGCHVETVLIEAVLSPL